MDRVTKTLREVFGVQSFRPGQEAAVRAILRGRDTLAVMPTGGGKSLCFQLPALLLTGTTLVVSPMIALMRDQVAHLTGRGVPACAIDSLMTPAERAEALQRARAGAFRLLYVSPERLSQPGFRELLRGVRVPLVVVDEAHCLSRWGRQFRPEYGQIAAFLRDRAERPVVAAFTATASPRVRRDVAKQLEMRHPKVVRLPVRREELTFHVSFPESKLAFTKAWLASREGSGVIFCPTRRCVDRLHESLTSAGFDAARCHAGLEREERLAQQERFLSGKVRVMVATSAFGLGVDKADVRWVLHYACPGSLEDYVQEAGRAGRDGRGAECRLLFHPLDMRVWQFFLKQLRQDKALTKAEKRREVRRRERDLREMAAYALSSGCLARRISRSFGDAPGWRCGRCSGCAPLADEPIIAVRPGNVARFTPDELLRLGLERARRAEARRLGVPLRLLLPDALMEQVIRTRSDAPLAGAGCALGEDARRRRDAAVRSFLRSCENHRRET